jgi:hypothetical protein
VLSGLDIDDDSEEELQYQQQRRQQREQMQPQRSQSSTHVAQQRSPGSTRPSSSVDIAHLTPASATSAHPTSDTPPGWSTFLDGAKKLIDTLIDLGSDSETGEDLGRAPDTASTSRRSHLNDAQRRPPEFDTPAKEGAEHASQDADAGNQAALALPTTPPTALAASTTQTCPELSEPSTLLEERHVRALVAEVPLRHRQARWRLAYSTQRDGISLQTMLRKVKGCSPTVLVVRDMGRAVFGAFCSEPWRVSPRYFGTGETFVFTVSPREAVWHWWWRKMPVQQNDFFMWAAAEGIAVGGAGGYALYLDAELSAGVSRTSATFGNECLASDEEFRIGAVECWWLS